MIDGHTGLAHHLLKIAVANTIAAIPANGSQNSFALKMPPFEPLIDIYKIVTERCPEDTCFNDRYKVTKLMPDYR